MQSLQDEEESPVSDYVAKSTYISELMTMLQNLHL